MRRLIHAAMAVPGVLVWLVTIAPCVAMAAWADLGDRLWPEAGRGNCWTWALARWWQKGGALVITIRRVGPLRIPHAAWRSPEGVELETEPIVRRKTARQAWWGLATLYFRYRVVRAKGR